MSEWADLIYIRNINYDNIVIMITETRKMYKTTHSLRILFPYGHMYVKECN